jgi:two-component system sensor histidine kinase GlrK
LVIHGMQGTRNNQVLFEQISALERSARLYRIIGNTDFLDAYARNNARLNLAAKELYDLPVNDESRADLNVLQGETLRLLQELKEAPPNSPRMATAIDAFAPLTDLVTKISDRTNAQIDAELSSLQLQAERAQQHLFWQTLLLVPMTLAVVGLFTYLFGRPIRAIDRAISELGRGTFSRPSSNGYGGACSTSHKRKIAFCDTCRMNSRRRSPISVKVRNFSWTAPSANCRARSGRSPRSCGITA